MKKINNFENVQAATGEFNNGRIPAGGYIVAVTSVEDVPDKEYLRVNFDVCNGDYKLFFTKQYEADTRPTKYWPNGGSMIRSYKEKALPMFKGFITAVENSNKGFSWDWDESKLKNKKFGVIIGDEEYEYTNKNGEHKVGTRNYVQAVRSIDVIQSGDFKVPELKKLKQTAETTTAPKQEFHNPFADDVPSVNTAPTTDETPFDEDNPFF